MTARFQVMPWDLDRLTYDVFRAFCRAIDQAEEAEGRRG